MKLDIVECSFDKYDIRSLVSMASDVLDKASEDERFQNWVRYIKQDEEGGEDNFDLNETWWIYHCGEEGTLFRIGFTLGNVGFGVALVEIEL